MSERRLRVAALGAQGDGIAQADGERVFVPGGLPGETWIERGPETADGPGTFELVEGACARAEPVCQHFGQCGGCVAQHMAPDLYADWKRDIVRNAMRQHGIDCDPRPLGAVGEYGRRRAVLTAERDRDGRIGLGYHQMRSHDLVAIEECPVLVTDIVAGLDGLKQIVSAILDKAGRARLTVVAAEQGLDVDVSECGAVVDPDARGRLAELVKQHRVVRLTMGDDTIAMLGQPTARLGGVSVPLPRATLFLQAVAAAERDMAEIVFEGLRGCKRVVDLFSGAGSFTFRLAERSRVLAVDADRVAIGALEKGRDGAQGLKPIETLVRDLFRQPLSRKELEPFDGAVFDPPRAGGEAQATMLAKSGLGTVVAVSCNPGTLARDLRILIDGGYELEFIQPVDQFRYSTHVECVAVLGRAVRRTGRRRR